MIKEAIIKVAKKEDLTYEESKAVMNEIMDGETSQVQTAAYLTALAMKGETIDEITGSAEGMRSHALQLKHCADTQFFSDRCHIFHRSVISLCKQETDPNLFQYFFTLFRCQRDLYTQGFQYIRCS